MITDRRRLGQRCRSRPDSSGGGMAARAGIHLIQIRERDMADGALAARWSRRPSRPFAAPGRAFSSTTGWTSPSRLVRTVCTSGATRRLLARAGNGAAGVSDRPIGARARRDRSQVERGWRRLSALRNGIRDRVEARVALAAGVAGLADAVRRRGRECRCLAVGGMTRGYGRVSWYRTGVRGSRRLVSLPTVPEARRRSAR